MTTNSRRHQFQLKDAVSGRYISDTGGKVGVYATGSLVKAALYTAAGASASNPSSLSSGAAEFWVADSVEAVDLYIQSPTGHFVVIENVRAGAINEVAVNLAARDTLYMIPFDIDDDAIAANTEYDTGFDLLSNCQVLPDGGGALVVEADSGIVLDVGLLSSESGGDADGFYDGLSMTSLGFVQPTIGLSIGTTQAFVDIAGGSQEYTFGVLLLGANTKTVTVGEGADAQGNAGFYLKQPHTGNGTATSISLTLASSADTAAGIVMLPVAIRRAL